MTSIFTLSCYVRGDNNTFEVQIETDKVFSTLCRIIQKKLSPRFNKIPASNIVLRKVSVPDSENLSIDVEEYLQSNQNEALRGLQPLSTCFQPEPVKGSIHIVVDPPYIQADLSPIQLFCFVKVDNHAFQIEIVRDEHIPVLKDIIKEKLSPRFDKFPADSLVLRKVSIPYSENISTDVEECFESNQFTPIWDNGLISSHFQQDPVVGHIHIVVTARPIQTDPSPLEFLCFCIGGIDAFRVNIGRDQSVAALKDIIQELRTPSLDKVPLNSLVVRKVLIPDRGALRTDVEECLQSNQFELLHDTDILSSIFQQDPAKEYIHIIVDYPTRPIQLLCIIEGNTEYGFLVDIGRDKSVAALKDFIRKKPAARLNGIPTNALVMRKISIPYGVDPRAEIEECFQSNQFEWLHDTEILSSCFQQDPIGKHIHIVITVLSIREVLLAYVMGPGRPSA